MVKPLRVPFHDHWPLLLRWSCALALLGTTLALSAPCAAQADAPPTARLTDKQARTLGKAVKLARDGKYQDALEVYDGLLTELDMNLLHLNRGRVLQKMGQCTEARAAFDRVMGAPRDPNITLDAIRSSLGRYNKELEAKCPGSLQIQCSQPEMTVRIDGGQQGPCPKEPIELSAGEHRVSGLIHGQEVSQTINIQGTRTTATSLALSPNQWTAAGKYLLGQGQYQRAERVLEQALKRKESQDLYLYIGESLLGQERCQEAFVALGAAQDAPPAPGLSPLEFTGRLKILSEAFTDECGERVQLQCAPADLSVRIDGGSPKVCSPAPIFLSLGEHTISASLPGPDGTPPQVLQRTVDVKAGQVNKVELKLINEEGLSAVGWSGVGLMGLGVVSLGTALIIDRAALADEITLLRQLEANPFADAQSITNAQDQIDTLQTTNKVLIFGGGAALLVGGAMLSLDFFFNDSQEPALDRSGVRLGASPDGQAIMFYQGVWQ